jgi:acyl-CoA reductase-like NAD-dependent aldehyde dehydrogenase
VYDSFIEARAAYARDRQPSLASRRAALGQLGRLLRDHADDLAEAISTDFGNRSRHESRLLELFPAQAAIADAQRHLRRWMKPQRHWASRWFLPARCEIRPQPLGVVGIIVPWNYPLLLAIGPLVGALAAGNQVMVKMSEFTPRTGELLARLCMRAFPDGRVRVINGDAVVAGEFAALPFDHLLFTGSTAVGHRVMHAAAANLTPVTLELGGKSPALVGPEADIDLAADKIMFGKCLNAGQTCIAPDYVLLPRGSEAAFVDAARRSVARLYPTLASNPDYTSIINAGHWQRLQDTLADALAGGAVATALDGGESAAALAAAQKIAPTVIIQADASMRLMQEEIFGPLLPLQTYASLDEAIDFINARPRPLALYYFGNDAMHLERVLTETVAGGVTINETLLHISQDALPFGGVGASGMGAYHGRSGFDTFSKLKPVFHQSRFNALGLLKPPYGRRVEAMLKLLLK